MFSWDNPEDRVAVVQMNAELRHARLELLSAECATHQLRLRFSIEDLARYGEERPVAQGHRFSRRAKRLLRFHRKTNSPGRPALPR